MKSFRPKGGDGGDPGAGRNRERDFNGRHALIILVVNDVQQPLDPIATDTGDDADLSEMRAHRIDQRRALANEEPPGSAQHQDRLLLKRFDLDEPHVGARHRLAHRFRARTIVLVALDIGLDVARRH